VTDLLDSLARCLNGLPLHKEAAYRLAECNTYQSQMIIQTAAKIRDRFKARRISYSRKVFIPLTNMCRNKCGYCAFRRSPSEPDAKILTPSEVFSLAESGRKAGCTEALFMLGEKPEECYSEAGQWLKKLGYSGMFEYLTDMCKMVVEKTGLLPHSNVGIMSIEDMNWLKDTNASMGLMLENVSERLCGEGGPHELSPSKHPRERLTTIENAGKLRIPFTTGLLVGIGETMEEIVDSLYVIKELHKKYRHIQEVIIQNFKAKPRTPMKHHPEPTTQHVAKIVAIARLILGGKMNIQVPPNLTSTVYSEYLDAGINDWGGISPVTIDFVNPEAPWPSIKQLRKVTEEKGFQLRARLPVYPEYIKSKLGFVPQFLESRIKSLVDEEGYVKGADKLQ
jgi:FO synthase subunit 1